jgi:multidrug efflux pump subunit AcrA (membrane-fusion protein)
MLSRYGLRIALATLLGLAVAAAGFGQQTTPTPTTVKPVSSTSAVVWLVSSLAIGAVTVYFLLKRGKGQPEKGPAYVGCTQMTDHGTVLTDESNHQDYVILPGRITLKPGERVEVSGTKDEDDAGRIALHVERLIKDYGGCKSTPAAPSATPQ